MEESLFLVPDGAVVDDHASDGGLLDEMYLRSCVLYIPPAACDANYFQTLVAAVRHGGAGVS